MKTSLTNLILSSILLKAINCTNVYRLITIDNGFEIFESEFLFNYQIKKFSTLLFKIPKEKYENPSQKNSLEEINEVPEYTGFIKYFYDELSWELISTKTGEIGFKLFDYEKEAFGDFCYPAESFKVEQNFFGEDREYKVNNTQNTQTFQNGSIFPPFLGFFSQKNVGENTGFSVNMANTQFSFLKNVYYIEDFESELEEIQISKLTVSSSFAFIYEINWEDITVNMVIKEGASGQNLSRYSKKVILKDDENKLRLKFLDISRTFHLGFETTRGKLETLNRNDENYAFSLFYCEIILDGFKRYFYKTERPAKSINEQKIWGDNEPIADDGSLQRVADNCFNYGMDAQSNSNSDVFNRRIQYYILYSYKSLADKFFIPYTIKGEENTKIYKINHILLTINFVSYFEEDEKDGKIFI